MTLSAMPSLRSMAARIGSASSSSSGGSPRKSIMAPSNGRGCPFCVIGTAAAAHPRAHWLRRAAHANVTRAGERRVRVRRGIGWMLAAALSGCGVSFEEANLKLRDASLADRCADIMRRALPGEKFDITDQGTRRDDRSPNVATMTAEVDAVRPDVPATGFLARKVAVECRFENGILTSFRWTAGPYR